MNLAVCWFLALVAVVVLRMSFRRSACDSLDNTYRRAVCQASGRDIESASVDVAKSAARASPHFDGLIGTCWWLNQLWLACVIFLIALEGLLHGRMAFVVVQFCFLLTTVAVVTTNCH